HVHEDANVEQLGPVRVGFKLSSTDAATKRMLPTDSRSVSFDVPPTKLISAVWTAQNQTDRERTQPAFNEFLRFRAAAAAELEKDGGDFPQEMRNNTHAVKTLFYMAGYALPFLVDAAKDQDPFIREQSIPAYSYAARAITQLDAYLNELDTLGPRPQWALTLRKNHHGDLPDWRSFATRALNDPAPNVRIAAVSVLTKTDWNQYGFDVLQHSIGTPKPQAQQPDDEYTLQEFNAVKALSTDRDAGVRAAVQKYLASLANKDFATDTVVEALIDPDPTVRQNALNALLRSPEPPPLESIKRAFAAAKEDTAIGLIPLLLEQEDSTLAATLGKDFLQRSEAERLAIMTALAGHSDSHALDLIKSALSDASPVIQRAALLRLLAFPSATASPLLDSYLRSGSIQQRRLAEAVWTEIEKRPRWPFLKRATSASETVFPSRNGTMPLTSPDGQWIAYVETGWGRPGGSGGFGRSNLISISHVVRNDGTDDRIVSDMFLVGWLSDSKRVGTARDAFVAISDFDGNVVAEFGDRREEQYRGNAKPHWTKGDLRSQFGQHMPHQKRLKGTEDFGFGEGGAFSPDGKWYGPLQDSQGAFFLGVGGQRMPIKISGAFSRRGLHAKWSPDGRFVQLDGASTWLIIDMQTQDSAEIPNVDDTIFPSDFASTGCCGNPWSRDSTALVFVRNGQIWVADARGKEARQLTFDSTRK
ncbi:MAG TPA: hypothetical protein VFR12_00060, partial [Pyrinomonadaceae bacterium]|nr:hypothetical protein [Pyrinomonadaceae bacterium]